METALGKTEQSEHFTLKINPESKHTQKHNEWLQGDALCCNCLLFVLTAPPPKKCLGHVTVTGQAWLKLCVPPLLPGERTWVMEESRAAERPLEPPPPASITAPTLHICLHLLSAPWVENGRSTGELVEHRWR